MSDIDSADVGVDVEMPRDTFITLMDAVPAVLKKSLVHGGLIRGIHKVAKALDSGKVLCCFLAQSCSEPTYTDLVKALCALAHVPLIDVPDSKDLGKWSGLCKYDKEGKPRKIVGASCVAITCWGEETSALNYLKTHIEALQVTA